MFNKTTTILFIVTIWLAHHAIANPYEELLQQYHQLEKILIEQLGLNQTQILPTKPNTPSALPAAKLPGHWQKQFLQEPVFQSKLFFIESGVQHRQSVILIHGMGYSGLEDWLNTIARLEKKYHVIALDLPGFGRSAVPRGRYSPKQYAKLVQWLVAQKAKGKVFVVGHSMGAAVTLRYAADFPKQVAKVVLVDAAGILERTAFLKYLAQSPINQSNLPPETKVFSDQLKLLSDTFLEIAATQYDPTIFLKYSDFLWNQVFYGRPNLNAAMALVGENFNTAIKQFPHDTIIIWGENDHITPLRTGRMLAGRLPKAKLRLIKNANHVPMSSHSNIFNQLLEESLAEDWLTLANNTTPMEKIAQLPSQGKLTCREQKNMTYSGRYTEINISDCANITLLDVAANNITINNSIVELINTRVVSDSIALQIKNSRVTATHGKFGGEIGIYAENSHLDFAGVSISGLINAVEIGQQCHLLFSTSDLLSDTYTGFVHGAFNPENTSIDSLLKNNF